MNINKTNYVIFSLGRKIVTPIKLLFINNVIVERVASTSFSGVRIDERLTFKNHMQYIKIKIAEI